MSTETCHLCEEPFAEGDTFWAGDGTGEAAHISCILEMAAEETNGRRRALDVIVAHGHTMHCAKRLIWGDGECECDQGRTAYEKIIRKRWSGSAWSPDAPQAYTPPELFIKAKNDILYLLDRLAGNKAELRAGAADLRECATENEKFLELLGRVRDGFGADVQRSETPAWNEHMRHRANLIEDIRRAIEASNA